MPTSKNILKTIGPGLLWAGAAVGVSHLVQSTRAGANYGFYFVGFLLLANFLKYPAFEFGPRYATATGQSLINGYRQLGRWAVALYWILTVSTMFAIQGAVTIVTAGLVGNIFDIQLSINTIATIILLTTMTILVIGKYSVLDKLMKIIIISLSLTVIFAALKGFSKGFHPNPQFLNSFDFSKTTDIAFLIAFENAVPSQVPSNFFSARKKDMVVLLLLLPLPYNPVLNPNISRS
jgi:Mn2+/Fe2+ NRAMP family transporter